MSKPSTVVRALQAVRRGRTIMWADTGMNFGNYLYLWRYAHERRAAGHSVYVLVHDSALPWIRQFPKLETLSVTPDEVGFFDNRVVGHHPSEFGVHFDDQDIRGFVTDCLITERWLLDGKCTDDEDLLINVRRGDYYSNEDHRRLYGMNQQLYVRRAVERASGEHGLPRRIRVISDGLDWCREHLAWLGNHAPVDFGPPAAGPFADFSAVANARRLVLSNSTFSYWGGYVSNVLHPGAEAQVYAPSFHRRDLNAGLAWQLNPRWTIMSEANELA